MVFKCSNDIIVLCVCWALYPTNLLNQNEVNITLFSNE